MATRLQMRRIAMLLCATLIAGPIAGHAAARTGDTLKPLLAFRQCPLAPYLKAVYERPAQVDGRARFLTVTVTERPQAFVQCMIARGDVRCEASAYDGTMSRKAPLPASAVAALQRLGFAATVDGTNFSYRRALRGAPDFDAIAVLMLTALHDAYGVRADTGLDIYAPFAGDLVTACRR
jgi:hypothetical protein